MMYGTYRILPKRELGPPPASHLCVVHRTGLHRSLRSPSPPATVFRLLGQSTAHRRVAVRCKSLGHGNSLPPGSCIHGWDSHGLRIQCLGLSKWTLDSASRSASEVDSVGRQGSSKRQGKELLIHRPNREESISLLSLFWVLHALVKAHRTLDVSWPGAFKRRP